MLKAWIKKLLDVTGFLTSEYYRGRYDGWVACEERILEQIKKTKPELEDTILELLQ